jgi:anti-sigma factor RsiW
MTCCEFRGVHIYLAFGDLPAEDRGRAAVHLRQCASCAAEWEEYQRITDLARQLPAAPLPAALEAQLRVLLTRPGPSTAPAT